MRLLLVGAFPYPHRQGSQVYFQEQAIALRAAGAEVELLTYASHGPASDDPDDWRAVDGFVHRKAPSWTAPSGIRSGPSFGKPLADLGLAYALNDAIASSIRKSASFDCVLTHNLEAALVSKICQMTQGSSCPPVVYCVHTLMENELSAYFKCLKVLDNFHTKSFRDRIALRVKRVIDAAGGRLDRLAAQSCDGWIALTQSAKCVMKSASSAQGALIPPPIPDPRHRLAPIDPESICLRHDLIPGHFILYSGNLDAYQELDQLAAAAMLVERDRADRMALPIVVASHDPNVLSLGNDLNAVETRHVETDREMQGLIAGARATITMRRAEGGFPIKLANSLAWGTAPIVFHGAEWGLSHERNAWVAAPGRPDEALAEAILVLSQEPGLAARLGEGARQQYEMAHRPELAAERTLALIDGVRLARAAA